jgi:hypothetical protein
MLTLNFLLGYAPERNPDELVWSYMKRSSVPEHRCGGRKAARQDRGAARGHQAHATVGPVILPSTVCRLYYRLLELAPQALAMANRMHDGEATNHAGNSDAP